MRLRKSWKCLIGSLEAFGTWPRYTWRRGSPSLSRVCKQPHPSSLPPKLRISLCSLAVYKPTPLAVTPPFSLHPQSGIPYKRFLSHVAFLHKVLLLLVTANVVRSSHNLVTLLIKALGSSETSVLTRATLRNNPEDGILHSHSRENLKTCMALTGLAL
jgi:hypothetical protein